jgi:hypothetical protein
MKPDAAPPTDAQVQSQIVNFLWAIAELLRDAFRKSDNQNVILPFTVPPPPRLCAGTNQAESS